MGIDYSELGLEENIGRSLFESGSGYLERRLEGEALQYFKRHAIDAEMLFQFWHNTQPKHMKRLEKLYGPSYKRNVLNRLTHELNRRGVI